MACSLAVAAEADKVSSKLVYQVFHILPPSLDLHN